MLFLRGLLWRRGFTAAVLVVGTISAAVAAIGPLYARASSESTLTDELRAAGSRTGMAFTFTNHPGDTGVFSADERQIRTEAGVAGYGTPISGRSIAVTAKTPRESGTTPSTMAWRSDQCHQVTIVVGRCPSAVGEALVPANASSTTPDWKPGRMLTVHQSIPTLQGIIDGPVLGRLSIVGTYRPLDTSATYWFQRPYFVSQYGPAVKSALQVGVDAVFVTEAQFEAAPSFVPYVGYIDVPLEVGKIRLKDLPRLLREVAEVQSRFPRQTTAPTNPGMRTDLQAVLADAARDKRQVQNATLVVVLELAALSLLVLFQVVGGAVEARGDEIALAKLRGLRPTRTVLFALGEPVLTLALAAPLGLLLAFGVTESLTHAVLVDGTPVRLTAATGWALAAAFAGSAIAAALAAARTVTRPVLEQWRNTSPPRHGKRLLLVLDLVLAVVALATAIALRSGSRDRPRTVFLFAPALIVFAVALVGVRVLPRLGRLALPRTRASRYIAFFLALRQTVRRPSGLRLAALLAVAAGLATFAVCGEAVAMSNRNARAQTELGASRLMSVLFETAHDPQSIVDAVDPDGKWALASATWSPDGGPGSSATLIGPLMGVEPSRLDHVGFAVRGQLSPALLAAAITSPSTRPAAFTGNRLQVTLTASGLVNDQSTLDIGIRSGHSGGSAIPAGRLMAGTHTYTVPVPCADGCAFTGITIDRNVDSVGEVSGTVTLSAVAADAGPGFRPVNVRFGDRAAWRADELGFSASQRLEVSAAGVTSHYRDSDGSSPILTYADSPFEIPIVAAPNSATERVPTGGVYDFSGKLARYRVNRWSSPLPVVSDAGAMADLDYLRIALPNFDKESAWTVWLGRDAPRDAVVRLQRAGLLIEHVRTEKARVAELGRQGPALGLLLLLVCAVAAAVLALGGTAVSLLADGRRRSFELAALRVVGVPQRTLRRSAVAEQAMLLGAAVVLGLPSGYLAAAIVLPVVPEFSDTTPVVLRFSPPILLALACVAVFAALLWIAALVAGRALARAAVPARLREAGR